MRGWGLGTRLTHTKNRPRCYTKSPTAQDAFWPIPGLISCAEVTGRKGDCYLVHRMHIHIFYSGYCLGNKFVNIIPLTVSSVSSSGVLCVKPDRTVLYAWAINPGVVSG